MNITSKNQYKKIIASMVTSDLGSEILTFAIGLLILNETESAFNFGLSQLIGPLISFVLLPIKGSIIDKYNKKIVLALSQILSLVALVIFLFSIQESGLPSLIAIYSLLIILEISDQFYSVAVDSSIVALVADTYIQKVKSVRQVFGALTMVFIPVISGVLTYAVPFEFLVYFAIVFEALTIFIILGLDFNLYQTTVTDSREVEPKGLLAMFKIGLEYVVSYKKLLFALTFAMMINLLLGAINVGFPYIQITELNFSNVTYGISMGLTALGMIALGIFLSQREDYDYPLLVAVKNIIYIGLVFILLGLVLFLDLPQAVNVLSMFIISFSLGALITRANVPGGSWMTKHIPNQYHGRVFSLMNSAGELLTPLGIFIFSILFDTVSSHWVYIGSGILIILVIYLFLSLTKIDLKDNTLV